MGLDTRAYRKATLEWQEEWVIRTNEAGGRPVMFGLMWEPIGQVNYGLAGGYLKGRAPYTLEDAPDWHQDGLDELPWPGGLVGGMVSRNGDGPSFRGRVYTDYVENLTGRSLYAACDEMWQGDELFVITNALVVAAANPEAVTYIGIEQGEREALAKWFRVCVENDLVVSGDS